MTGRAAARSVSGLFAVVLMAGAISGVASGTASAAAPDPTSATDRSDSDQLLVSAPRPTGGTSNYIVTLENGASVATAVTQGEIVRKVSGPVSKGAVVALTPAEANNLKKSPGVADVERDSVVSAADDTKRPLETAQPTTGRVDATATA